MARRKNLSLSASVISLFRGKYFEIEFKFILFYVSYIMTDLKNSSPYIL